MGSRENGEHIESGDIGERTVPPVPSRGTRFPPLWVWLVILTCTAAIAWIRIGYVAGDHAVVNILTLICGFTGLVAVFLWFLFFTRIRGVLDWWDLLRWR